MAGITPSFLRRNIGRIDSNNMVSLGAVFEQVGSLSKLEEHSKWSMEVTISQKKIIPRRKKSSLLPKLVVTPTAAAPPWKGAPKRDALLSREAYVRQRVAELEGRVYISARRRYFVTTVEAGVTPCDLKVPCTRRIKVC